jgi:GNAT superfamily N-acetyltransferase
MATERQVKYSVQRATTTTAEIDAFLDAEWAAWHHDQGHDPTDDWSTSPVVLVARDDDQQKIIGVAAGRVSAGVGHLSELMVSQRTRGAGIGFDLVRRFEHHCETQGCHKITVHTDFDGPAHRFYERLGWRQEAMLRRDRGGRDFVRLCKFFAEV